MILLLSVIDLNPESYKYLVINVDKNQCTDAVTSHNLDGREFIVRMQESGVSTDHVRYIDKYTSVHYFPLNFSYGLRVTLRHLLIFRMTQKMEVSYTLQLISWIR